MTKLDAVLERIRQLPQDRQDAIAVDLEIILRDQEEGGLLAEEQDAELDRRLSDPDRQYVSHEEVGKYFEKKYGR